MKNMFIIISGLLLFTSIPVSAQTCIGGTIISGADKNRSFCFSDKTMNWWAAHQWCQSNGRVLAHPDNLCKYDGENWFLGSYGNCPNFAITGTHRSHFMWTSLSLESGKALAIGYNNYTYTRSFLDRVGAVCE